MKCCVVTPEKNVINQETDFVVVPLYDGEYAIAKGHTPVIGRLGAGELRLRSEGEVLRWYVEGGFVEVLNDTITILTTRAFPIAQLTEAMATRSFEEALTKDASTEELLHLRDIAIKTARTQKRLVQKSTQKHS